MNEADRLAGGEHATVRNTATPRRPDADHAAPVAAGDVSAPSTVDAALPRLPIVSYISCMNLFFVDDGIENERILIRDTEHFHLSRVLRLREGDELLLNNRSGVVHEARIERIDRDETCCRILHTFHDFNEARVDALLLQGILKNPGKMDWLIEKGVEIGMNGCIPLITQRSIPSSVRTERLRRISETAVKQCLRARIPVISDAMDIQHALPLLTGHRMLLFHESAALDSIPELLVCDERPIALFVGPEGGFTDEEVATLVDAGAEALSLGPRRLRGETAAIAALARVIARYEANTLPGSE
jgi:16S rRNA (uracil1498-N3)-methyltransferase